LTAPTKRNSRRGQTYDNDVPASLPPPVTDTVSWPTPDLAQGEFKKEKDEKEKEKPVPHTGRNKTWVPVPIDPPYVPPIQTKAGRGGRGNRVGREGGRGGVAGATHGGERAEKATGSGPGASGALESDRGRQYPNNRYQGGKGPKRSSSAGGAVQRRESKAGMTNGTSERRKDASEWAVEASSSGLAGAAMQTDRPRTTRVIEDASDARQYSEGQKSQANGYMHQSRSERGAGWYAEGPRDPDSSSPFTANTSRERGVERGRGGYRGRNHYAPFSHGHSNTTHLSNQQFSSQNASGQQFIRHPQPRGGSYGRREQAAYNNNPYRFNPTMQHPPPPQFAPAYGTPGLPYEYAMIPSGGLTAVDFAALIHQMSVSRPFMRTQHILYNR
jgi:la-related protein 1